MCEATTPRVQYTCLCIKKHKEATDLRGRGSCVAMSLGSINFALEKREFVWTKVGIMWRLNDGVW